MFSCKVMSTKVFSRLYRSNINQSVLINHPHLKHEIPACVRYASALDNSSYSILTRANIGAYLHISQTAGICTSSRFCVKGFIEYENNFAYGTMEIDPSYTNTLVTTKHVTPVQNICIDEYQSLLAKDWTLASPSEICRAFHDISHFCFKTNVSITEEMFDGLCKSLASNASGYTDSELAGILSALSLWPQTESLNSRNFECIWSSLDKECVARVKQWNTDSLLYFADHWYKLHLARVCNYMWHCIRKVGRKPNRLSPNQLVQSLFYVNICRKVNESISMFEYEHSIASCADKLSLNELAIVAMGFFKSQTRVRNPSLVAQMISRTADEIDTINEITLCSLLKFFRYSSPLTLADMVFNLLDKILPNVQRLSLLCCVHIALTGTNMQIFHEELFKILSQRFASNISSLRIKDIERVAFALSLFDYDPKTKPCIYEKILEELHKPERDEEIKKYPKCLTACLNYLTLRKIYPNQLISKVLAPEFITDTYGKFYKKIGREILSLDLSVFIECPNYDGNRLNPKLRRLLGREFIHWSPTANTKRLSITEKMMLEVIQTLEDTLGGPQYIYTGNVLPHFPRPDIVFGLRDIQSASEIPAEFKNIRVGDVRNPPQGSEASRWYCTLVCGSNSFIQESGKPLGSSVAKIRHLTILGYVPLIIPFYEWNNVPTTQRQKYMREKISMSLKS